MCVVIACGDGPVDKAHNAALSDRRRRGAQKAAHITAGYRRTRVTGSCNTADIMTVTGNGPDKIAALHRTAFVPADNTAEAGSSGAYRTGAVAVYNASGIHCRYAAVVPAARHVSGGFTSFNRSGVVLTAQHTHLTDKTRSSGGYRTGQHGAVFNRTVVKPDKAACLRVTG